MKCTNQLLYCVIDDMITQEKIQKLLLVKVWGGGMGGYIAKVLKQAVNCRTKFRNTHWLEKSLTTVDDKPVKLICKTSLNAFQKVLIKNLCGPMSTESWQKSMKRNIR